MSILSERAIRDAYLKKAGKTYAEYLRTDQWRKRRAKTIEHYQGKCYCCGLDGHEVHHRTYKRMGKEIPSDLVLLCQPCHAAVHDLVRYGTRLSAAHDALRKRKNHLPKNSQKKKFLPRGKKHHYGPKMFSHAKNNPIYPVKSYIVDKDSLPDWD